MTEHPNLTVLDRFRRILRGYNVVPALNIHAQLES